MYSPTVKETTVRMAQRVIPLVLLAALVLTALAGAGAP
ncbi:hypothetical protein DENIT_11001 [Pseudomonas veronii]|nr:hypothetical protein DENIT_11001 [Pseudomonas veronii]